MCKSFRFRLRSRYLSIALILSLVFPPSMLRADQYGADIVAGSAVINTQGSVMNINTQSDRTIINWQSFSIAQGNTTNFNQPSSTSAVLNRVTTPGNPSSILGTLNSNGNVYLINPSGIFIGPAGVVNTNGFTASVFDISNKDFMAGGNLKFEGNSTASVINQGAIYTGNGGIALLGHQVQNSGLLSSDGGAITLATGGSITLADGSRYIQADVRTLESGISETASLIQNSGTIRATGALKSGGEVYLVNPAGKILHSGTIKANQTVASNQTDGGKVVLQSKQGETKVTGAIDVTGDRGGSVQVLGQQVELAGAKIDASGNIGGGQILVGGDLKGKNPSIQNAQNTLVDASSQLKADAVTIGDGGEIIVWADNTTQFAGTISARGGATSGNGGFAEVSGQNHLGMTGWADLRAVNGSFGTLLLDPGSITIQDGLNTAPPAALDTFNDGWIANQLGAASVTLATSGSTNGGAETITVNGDVSIIWNSPTTLTLQAGRNIVVNSGALIENTFSGANFDAIVMQANTGGTATDSFAGIGITGGTLRTTGSGNINLNGTGGTGASAPGIRLASSAMIQSTGASNGGAISLTGTGSGGGGNSFGIFVNTSSLVSSASGAVQLTGTATGLDSSGILISNSGRVASTGTGTGAATINLNGSGTSIGLHVQVGSNAISTVDGNITITGAASAGTDIQLSSSGGIESTGSGNITLNGNSMNIATSNRINGGNNTVTLRPRTAGTEINLGADDAAGVLGLTNAELNLVTAGRLIIGRDDIATGQITVSSAIAPANANALEIITARNIVVNQNIIGGSGGVTLLANQQATSTAGNFVGITVQNGAIVTTTGTGNVTVRGRGGASDSGARYGVWVTGAGSQITSGGGAVLVTGTAGGGGASGGNVGVAVEQSGAITTAGMGSGATVTVQGFGNLDSQGGFNSGVRVNGSGSQIVSGDGSLSVEGTGGGVDGGGNYGVFVDFAGRIASTGTLSGSTVTVRGFGSTTAQSGNNEGVFVEGTGSRITSTVGAVLVEGFGGGQAGSSRGVYVDFGGLITSDGTGAGSTVTVRGTGSLASSIASNHGVRVSGNGARITSSGGQVLVEGTGGGVNGSNDNIGVLVGASGQISSGGSGGVHVIGRGGNTSGNGFDNHGVRVSGNNALITSAGGNVTVEGTGGGSGSGMFNDGVNMSSSGQIRAGGSGTVNVTGQGGNSSGTGNFNYGVAIYNDTTLISSGNGGGNVTVHGTGGGANTSGFNRGVFVNGQISAGGNGSVTVTGQGGNRTGNGDSNQGVFILNSRITSSGGNVTVNGTGGGSGTSISNIGVVAAFNGLMSSGGNGNIQVLGTGGNGTLAGIQLQNSGRIETAGTGEVVLATPGSFVNETGANAVSTGSRWLIYTAEPGVNTYGGLVSGQTALFNRTFAANPPSTISQTGSRYIFANQPTLTVTGNLSANKTYGDTFVFPTAVFGTNFTIGGFVNASSFGNVFTQDTAANIGLSGAPVFSSAGAAATASVAGSSYAINIAQGSLTNASGYAFAGFGPPIGFIEVTPRDITVAALGGTSVYGDSPVNPGLSATNLASFDTVAALTGLSNSFGINSTSTVGNSPYILTVDGTLTNSNYNVTQTNTGIWNVTPKTLVVTANNQTKTFGETLTFLGNEFSAPALINGDSITSVNLGSAGAVDTANVSGSPYAITIDNAVGTGLSNYSISYSNGLLTVTPRNITVTALGGSSVYGESPLNPGLSATNLASFDTVAALTGLSNSFGINSTSPVNNYTLNVVGTLTNPNYNVTQRNTGVWNVTPKTLVVTANNQTKTFGDAFNFMGNEFTAPGLINGDTITSVNLGSAGAVNTANVSGSPYAITIDNAVGSGLGNYSISYTNGLLAVTPRDITVTALGGSSIYGDSPLNPGLSATNLASFDTVAALTGLSNSFGINSTNPVNDYTLNVVGTLTNNNYSVTQRNTSVWNVTPKILVVTANNQTKTFGETFNFMGNEFTAPGLINGDTITSVNLGSAGAVNSANVIASPYAITIDSAVGSGLGNYSISYSNGLLTVMPRDITVTALGGSSIYGDSPLNPGLSATNLASFDTFAALTGLSNNFDINSTSPVNEYTLTVDGTLTNSNYNVTQTNTGVWNVTPRALVVTATLNQSKIYGANDPVLAFTPIGLVSNDTAAIISGALARAAGENVGLYAINQGTLSAGNNYTIQFTGADFQITPAQLTLRANDQVKTQGFTFTFNPATDFTAVGLAHAETIDSVSLSSLGAPSAAPPGVYAIDISNPVGAAFDPNNYQITFVPGELLVSPSPHNPFTYDQFDRYRDQWRTIFGLLGSGFGDVTITYGASSTPESEDSTDLLRLNSYQVFGAE